MSHHQETAHLTAPVGERDHSEGLESAPVTLVEYGDYECPYCGRAYPIIKQVQRHFGERLRFVFRNFPLSEMHPHAAHAAEAAEAAGAQERFWPMHDHLYEHQRALDDAHLLTYGKQLGLDEPRYARELASHAHAARVREDFMSGARSGVNGTPTFFINGRRHDGPYDLETLRAALERAETHG